jgi:hypothetical protein
MPNRNSDTESRGCFFRPQDFSYFSLA